MRWTDASPGAVAPTPQVAGLKKGTKRVSENGGGWRLPLPKSKVTLALIALIVLLVVAWLLTR